MTKSGNSKRAQKAASETSSVRIIGGRLRGSKVQFVPINGLRPSPGRVRETLFNWLSADLLNAHCLDLFAGSGILGFEALSRGAASLISIEKDKLACQHIDNNGQRLKIQSMNLLNTNALSWLDQQVMEKGSGDNLKDKSQPMGFDIVFLDPPFQSGLLESALKLLCNSVLLNDNALIYIERPKKQDLPAICPSWVQIKSKTAASVCFSLYQHRANGEESLV